MELETKLISCTAHVEGTNGTLIYLGSDFVTSCVPDEHVVTSLFNQNSHRYRFDGLSLIPKYGVGARTDAFGSLLRKIPIHTFHSQMLKICHYRAHPQT